MKPTRPSLIRLAYTKPELRPTLLPLIDHLRTAGAPFPVKVDLDIEPESGLNLRILDDGEPFEDSRGDSKEYLHWVETTDHLGEGSLIVGARNESPLSRGDQLEIMSANTRTHGQSWVGELITRKK